MLMELKRLGAQKLLQILAFLIILTSCMSINDKHGYFPLEKDIDQLIIGKTNKAQVIKIIGPAAISDGASWIYISSNVKSTAFFDPAVTDRNILFLEFSKKDILSSREIFTVEDGKFFDMHKTKEINDPRKINAFKQLFGNIGNFSAESFVNNN